MHTDTNESFASKIKHVFCPRNLIFFAVLLCLYIFRTPGDLFNPYLYCEDGEVLLSESIFDGFAAIFTPHSSTIWVIQRAVALFCYGICVPFGNIEYMPYVMMFVFKSLAVLSIMLFTSKRFEWLVPKRLHRLFICAAIILMIPQGTLDIMTCDTSVPFALFFAAALIGLDLLCGGKEKKLSVPDTVFFVLMALSYAGCVFIALFAVIGLVKWYAASIKTGGVQGKELAQELIKTGAVLAATAIQLSTILSGDRISTELDLSGRLIANTKAFIFFPYWQEFDSWIAFFAGVLAWLLLIKFTGFSKKVALYCGALSWMHMFYCSMTSNVTDFYPINISLASVLEDIEGETPRFEFTCVALATLMLGCVISRLIESSGGAKRVLRRFAGIAMACVLLIIGIATYTVPVMGEEYSSAYAAHSGLYALGGADTLEIPIPPYKPWTCKITADISEINALDDLVFDITYVDQEAVDNSAREDNDTEAFLLQLVPSNGRMPIYDVIAGQASAGDFGVFCRMVIKTGDNSYRAVNPVIEEDDANFSFIIRDTELSQDAEGNSTIEILGQTEDGVWHRGKLDVTVVYK